MPKYNRQKIIELHKRGATLSEISKELRINLNTARRWVTRWQNGGSLTDRSRIGRPKKVTPEMRAEIFRLMDEGLTHREISAVIRPKISAGTVYLVICEEFSYERKKKITTETKEEIFRLAERGFNSREIADAIKLTLSRESICKILRERFEYKGGRWVKRTT